MDTRRSESRRSARASMWSRRDWCLPSTRAVLKRRGASQEQALGAPTPRLDDTLVDERFPAYHVLWFVLDVSIATDFVTILTVVA